MDKVDIHDPQQNQFVQDWLSQYQNMTRTQLSEDENDGDMAFDVVIEALQETYTPYGYERLPDIDAATIMVTTDALGHPQSYDVYGSDLNGKSKWIHIITRSQIRFAHRVAE